MDFKFFRFLLFIVVLFVMLKGTDEELFPLFLFLEVQAMVCFLVVLFLHPKILIQGLLEHTFYPVVCVYGERVPHQFVDLPLKRQCT